MGGMTYGKGFDLMSPMTVYTKRIADSPRKIAINAKT